MRKISLKQRGKNSKYSEKLRKTPIYTKSFFKKHEFLFSGYQSIAKNSIICKKGAKRLKLHLDFFYYPSINITQFSPSKCNTLAKGILWKLTWIGLWSRAKPVRKRIMYFKAGFAMYSFQSLLSVLQNVDFIEGTWICK